VYSSNNKYGYSFEYPKLYETNTYSTCMPTVIDSDYYLQYLRFGYRSELAIAVNKLPSFDQFVDQWIIGMDIEYKDYQWINDIKAITVDYRFGGLNRFGTTTFIGQDDLVFIFNFTAGGSCDLDEIGLDEYTIYRHAVETFKLYSYNP